MAAKTFEILFGLWSVCGINMRELWRSLRKYYFASLHNVGCGCRPIDFGLVCQAADEKNFRVRRFSGVVFGVYMYDEWVKEMNFLLS